MSISERAINALLKFGLIFLLIIVLSLVKELKAESSGDKAVIVFKLGQGGCPEYHSVKELSLKAESQHTPKRFYCE